MLIALVLLVLEQETKSLPKLLPNFIGQLHLRMSGRRSGSFAIAGKGSERGTLVGGRNESITHDCAAIVNVSGNDEIRRTGGSDIIQVRYLCVCAFPHHSAKHGPSRPGESDDLASVIDTRRRTPNIARDLIPPLYAGLPHPNEGFEKPGAFLVCRQ